MGKWRRRHNNSRNGCGSMRVEQDVVNAIKTLLLRSPQRPFWIRQVGPNDSCHSVLMASASGKFLPSVLPNLAAAATAPPWAQACDHCLPRWHFELCLSQRLRDRAIQQPPRTLKIPHCGDFLQLTGLFGCRGVHIWVLPNSSQDLEAAMTRVEVLNSCSCGEVISWMQAGSSPALFQTWVFPSCTWM